MFIYTDYRLFCDSKQEILLLIYYGYENDYYLIKISNYCFMTNFLFNTLVPL